MLCQSWHPVSVGWKDLWRSPDTGLLPAPDQIGHSCVWPQSLSLILVCLHSTWSIGALFSDSWILRVHGGHKKVYLGCPPPSASIREGKPEGLLNQHVFSLLAGSCAEFTS